MSIIHKVHSGEKQADSMEFVLSDATPDRYGDVIMADGWVLDNFKKNPIALFGHRSDFPIGTWENLKVKDGALRGFLKMAPEGTSERIDEIRKLIDAGVLKAVSVGFRPIDSKAISATEYGEIYLKQELVETSVVTVPANPNALAVAKGLGISRETLDVVFAKHGNEVTITQRSGHGKQAANHTSNHGKKKTMTLAQRIEEAQAHILDLRSQLDDHISKMADDPDDAYTATTDQLSTQLELKEKSLVSLQKAEKQLAKAATGTALTTTVTQVERTAADRGSEQTMTIRNANPFPVAKEKIRPMDYIFKALAVDVKCFGEGRKRNTLDVLKETYGENEIIRTVMARLVTKAAAIPADTTTSGWADTLIQTVIGDFIQSLLPNSIYPGLAAKGGSFTYGRNGVVSLPARNTATTVAGAFVAQGAAIPVRQGAFTPITLTPKKMGVITTMTREITEHSTPAIEAILRQAMLEDTGVAIDAVLLDANAATTTRPAGLKNGVSKTSASATASIVGFITDLKALAGALITGTKGNIRAPVWIMSPADVLAATLIQTTTGDTPFRDEVAAGTLLGYPILQSTTLAARGMLLVDAADFITATGDTPNFSVSDQAVLHMEDTSPTGIGTVGTPNVVAAPVRSLWQTDSIAIRMIMDINWAMRRTGVIAWTDTMVW